MENGLRDRARDFMYSLKLEKIETEIYYCSILHGCLTFLYILQAEAMAAFVLEYLFKGICIENSLGRQRYGPSMEQKAGSLTAQNNRM